MASNTTFILANTASPVMWTQYLHLLYGNAIIGVLESIFLVSVFKTRPVRTVALVVPANYVSMFCGLLIFGFMEANGPIHSAFRPTIYNYQLWLVIAVLISFALTVIIEWPFCFASFAAERRKWRYAIRACLLTQALSYAICIGLPYFSRSEINIRAAVSIEPVSEVVATGMPFRVYFIDPESGDVHRMRPDGSQREHVMEASLEHHGKLAVMNDLEEAEAPEDPLWDLSGLDYDRGDQIPLVADFAPPESAFLTDGRLDAFSVMFNIHDAAELREPDDREWRVRCRDNAGLAAGIRPAGSDELDLGFEEGDIHLSFSTGFGTWKGRNASILPGDLVIFEFGGQICALDLNRRMLALICFGYGPVVVRDGDRGADLEPIGMSGEQRTVAEGRPSQERSMPSIDAQYFSRAARFIVLGEDTTVIDPHSPRMITMDPWPELVFRSADGEQTVGQFIDYLASSYEDGPPPGLDEEVRSVVRALEREGILRLHDLAETLPTEFRDPVPAEGDR